MAQEKKLSAQQEAKRKRREYEKTLKHYKKTEIVDMLCGVLDLPRDKVSEAFSAVCDLLVELSFTESIVSIPKFGRFVFEPTKQRKIWNPKEAQSLIYQNPKITFRVAHKLRSMLRKKYRRNCYQLADLNNVKKEDFKPPKKQSKSTGEQPSSE